MAEEIDEIVRTLARRREFLATLADRPMEKPALADELDVARSTVDRGLRDLEMAGFVRRGDEGYEPTAGGRLALEEFDRFSDAVSGVREAADVVSAVPDSDAVDLSSDLFVDASVVASSVSAPDRPLREVVDLVEDATSVRGFSPSSHSAYVDVFHRRIVEAGMEAELVFSADALAELTGTHGDRLQAAIDTGRVDVYRIEELPPIGLVLADERDGGDPEACAVIYDEAGIEGVVRNDTEAALAWADETYRCVRDRADEVPL